MLLIVCSVIWGQVWVLLSDETTSETESIFLILPNHNRVTYSSCNYPHSQITFAVASLNRFSGQIRQSKLKTFLYQGTLQKGCIDDIICVSHR